MFSVFAERVVGHRVTLHPVRTIVVAALVLVISAGLVALGRWTAPTAPTSASSAAPVRNTCGPTTPTHGCQQVLREVHFGARADMACGTIAPSVMPSAACQRVLERIYLGAGH